MRPIIRGVILIFLLAAPALAVEPSEVLSDPVLEQRARVLSQELRCLVCQNQSIDDSNAGLAKDLRVLVRERLVAGDSDQEVLDFLVARYGDFVLLRPPMRPSTYALWVSPFAVLLFAVIGLTFYFRRQRQSESPNPAESLSDQEKASLNQFLAETEEK